MKKLSLLLIFVLFTLFIVIGCSSKNIKKVDVYEMESFSVIKKDSLTSFRNSNVISYFVYAFKNARKEQGAVNMVDPKYKVVIGEESYYLWLSEGHGTIMNVNDTNTIYTLSKYSAKSINELLN